MDPDALSDLPQGLDNATLNDALRGAAPINLERAYQVMEQEELQGIVVGDPLNVFHLTGYWPQIALTKAGQPPTTFAVLARDPARGRALVSSKFIYYYTVGDSGFRQDIEPYLYYQPGDEGDLPPEARLAATADFADRHMAPLTDIEIRRRSNLSAATNRRHIRRDAGGALVAAMRDLDMWRGRIAFDHNVIAAVCEHHDHPGRPIQADNILRKIRLIKSPLEIELMRRASWANVAAVQAAAKTIRTGMSYQELRAGYYQEAVARGNLPVFMTIDRVSAPLADATIKDGDAFFIDGVSHYQHYHGDYARTVFVGEPTAAMRRAADAVAFGWGAVREALKPGMRYSEIYALGQSAIRKAGFDFTISFGPHSVGLSHTDEPCREQGGFYIKDDIVLQENMILSVDCPILDTGLGGSAHIEDLMLITRDGAEPLHALSAPVIVI
jgi:Xaa-Pro aminopeptidase